MTTSARATPAILARPRVTYDPFKMLTQSGVAFTVGDRVYDKQGGWFGTVTRVSKDQRWLSVEWNDLVSEQEVQTTRVVLVK